MRIIWEGINQRALFNVWVQTGFLLTAEKELCATYKKTKTTKNNGKSLTQGCKNEKASCGDVIKQITSATIFLTIVAKSKIEACAVNLTCC